MRSQRTPSADWGTDALLRLTPRAEKNRRAGFLSRERFRRLQRLTSSPPGFLELLWGQVAHAGLGLKIGSCKLVALLGAAQQPMRCFDAIGRNADPKVRRHADHQLRAVVAQLGGLEKIGGGARGIARYAAA